MARLMADDTFFFLRNKVDLEPFIQRLQEYIGDGDISDDDILTLGGNIVINMTYYHDLPEGGMQLLPLLKAAARSPSSRIRYYMAEFIVYLEEMQAEKAAESFDALWQIYQELPDRDRDDNLTISVRQITLFRGKLSVLVRNAAEARQYLNMAAEIPVSRDSLWDLIAKKDLEAKIVRLEGKQEETILICRELADMMGKLFGKTDLEYLTLRGEMAISLNLTGRTEEAITIYDDCIDKYKSRYKTPNARLQIWLNNRGVALISAERPEEAIQSLLEAQKLAESMEEIAKAEVCNNLGKAYRLLRDPEKEKEYLLMSAPIFTAFYGPENAKTVYVRNRLAELAHA